jgi:hypothetical protein
VPLERALALDPGIPELTQHAMIMAARDRRFEDVRSLITRAAHDANIRRQVAGMRAAIAFGTANPSARDTLKLLLDSADSTTSTWIGHVLLWATDSLSATEAAFRYVSAERGFPEEVIAFSRTNVAALALAAGRWKDGLGQFAALPDSLPQVRTVLPAWFVAMPFVQRPSDEIIRLRESVSRLTQVPNTLRWDGVTVPPRLRPWLKEYLYGLLSARLGDHAAADSNARILENATVPEDSISMRRDLALEIRALDAMQSGHLAEALTLLERQEFRMQTFGAFNGFARRSFGRFLRAELLAKLGRDEEALAWFRVFDGDPFWGLEFVFSAPALFRMGEIHERLGHRTAALDCYRRFIARWRQADPQYQPMIRAAEAKIIALR